MLLKIFVPLAVLIVPILVSVNAIGGRGESFGSEAPFNKYNNSNSPWQPIVGLNKLAWSNVRPDNADRYWTHLIMAIIVVVYCCYTFFDELRGYVRLRQAYLTSPQHRLRASATTVLVSGIPRKWCTAEALEGLYDVFPGGIRNIWVNRNFDELNDKVKRRNKIAIKLEQAETNLIRKAKKAHMKELEKEAKKAGKKTSKKEKAAERQEDDKRAAAMADADGSSVGDQDQEIGGGSRHSVNEPEDKQPILNVPIPVLGRGVEAVGTGITTLGKTVFGSIKNVGHEVDSALATTQGFQTSTEELTRSEENAAASSDSAFPERTVSRDHTEDHLSSSAAEASEAMPDADHLGHGPSEDDNTKALEVGTNAASAIEDLHQNNANFGTSDKEQDDSKRPTTSDSWKVHTVALHGKTKYTFWRQPRNAIQVPDPLPHGYLPNDAHVHAPTKSNKYWWEFWKSEAPSQKDEYPVAHDKNYDPHEGEPLWKRYLKPADRDTMRLPVFGVEALSWLPFVGKKVDTIDYCRTELARLNVEIEQDQREPEKYPLMNSAFIQFNHQVAAHMACQSVSHHIPMQMNPRAVEIAPNDVLWNNMSIRWWERWIRTFFIVVLVIALILAWAVPVAFTGLLSSISAVAHTVPWLAWLANAPQELQGIIQGVLPPLLLALLLLILPLFLHLLAKLQGVSTGTAAQLATSWYYFFFLFVQVFLVVTIAASVTNIITTIKQVGTNLSFIPTLLAGNVPSASNYFFSYILLQALSTSAAVLLQLVGLLGWFILAPLLDSTAREKWKRQVNLPEVRWGTFFPLYTNFACIGLIYSTIAPLMLLFLIVTFGLFWFVYRYQTLYITKFALDTGGLLFPQAVNQLFTGLYVMEIALIGLFSLAQGVNMETGEPDGYPCTAQAIIMVVVLACTLAFQILLNKSLGPLFRYLPITLEDDAVVRDEEFARAQDKKLQLDDNEKEGDDINDVLEERERQSAEEDLQAEALELRDIETRKNRRLNPIQLAAAVPSAISRLVPGSESWGATRGRSYQAGKSARSRSRDRSSSANWVHEQHQHAVDVNAGPEEVIRQHRLRVAGGSAKRDDKEANPHASIAEALFAGINDEIEDLTPDERDILVRRAFRHEALRARRPVVWIPHDDLGVSEDEIRRTKRLSPEIWITNEHTGLDGKARVVYRKSPPDFSQLDLIVL